MQLNPRVVSLVGFALFSFCLYSLLSASSSPSHEVRKGTWLYPERASSEHMDTVYKQCGSLIPPKAKWGSQHRPEESIRGHRLPMVPVKNREDLGCLVELYGLKTGAELGVKAGLFSKEMLSRWRSCEKYILVDVWKQQEHYDDGSNVSDREQESRYQETKRILESYANVTEFFRMYTTEAARLVPDDSLDFIYIDARHDYCGVREDLHTWWPKLRMGGIFAGHDYVSSEEHGKPTWRKCMDGSEGSGAVKGAVNEFAFANNLQVLDTSDLSWYLQKIM